MCAECVFVRMVTMCEWTCCEDCVCALMLMMVDVRGGVWIVFTLVENGACAGVWIYLFVYTYTFVC